MSPRVLALLAYAGWWVTGLAVWYVERRDPYIRFHAAQAMTAFGTLALCIAGFLGLAVVSLSFLPRAFGPFVWAAAVTSAIGLLLWLVSMWKAARGAHWRIPIAADLADRLV